MIRNTSKLTALAVATLLGGVVTVNCSKNGGDDKNAGHINLALSLPSGAHVDQVHYVIHAGAPAGIPDVSENINTLDPNATGSAYHSFPASTGDVVTLTATTSAGKSCTGSSMPFNVTAGGVAMVDVTLVCGGSVPTQGSGSVKINSTVVEGDNCPLLTSWAASPLVTSLGGKIDVAGAATDADVGVIPGEAISFKWTGGSFVADTAAATQFTCTVAGANTLTLTVSDNHAPTPCTTQITIPVTCVGGIVCGNGVIEMGEDCETPGVGTCDALCHRLPPVCGNGIIEGTETCDPPASGSCDANCHIIAAAVCGNGIVEAGETCELPNTATCDAACHTISETACGLCERTKTNVSGDCFQTSNTANAGTNDFTKFGCNGFSGADKTNCDALIGCMRTNHCGAGNDPTPCLCGALSAATCATTSPASLPGVCAAKYITAAAGGDVFGLFFSTDSPIGVSNNLYSCDVDACTAQCL